jgi:hypothetical protein
LHFAVRALIFAIGALFCTKGGSVMDTVASTAAVTTINIAKDDLISFVPKVNQPGVTQYKMKLFPTCYRNCLVFIPFTCT